MKTDEAMSLLVLRKIDSMISHLQRLKVKADVLPVPVDYDREGTSVKNYTVRQHFAKLNEEMDEFKNEVLSVATLDERLSESRTYYEDKARIVGKASDIMVKLWGICRLVGADDGFILAGVHNTNVKNRDRGYLGNGT